jgi:hypothetical protein
MSENRPIFEISKSSIRFPAKNSSSLRHSYQSIPDRSLDNPIVVIVSEGSVSPRLSDDKKSYWIGIISSLIVGMVITFVTSLYLYKLSSQSMVSMGASSPVFAPLIKYDSIKDVYTLYDSDTNSVLATGSYIKNVGSNGWNYLEAIAADLPTVSAKTEALKSDLLVEKYIISLRAVGYLEGYMTCHDITAWYLNFYNGLFDGGDPTEDALDFLQTNYDWMVRMSEQHWKYSEHWLAVRGLLAQLNGMVAGVQDGCPGSESSSAKTEAFLPTLKKRPSTIHFLLMNSNGDLYQIADKFDQKDAPPSDVIPDDLLNSVVGGGGSNRKLDQVTAKQLSTQDIMSRRRSSRKKLLAPSDEADSDTEVDNTVRLSPGRWTKDHCSAIVKLLPDKSDIVFGHNTWDDYQLMAPRIFKHISHQLLTPKRDGNSFTYHVQYETNPTTSSKPKLMKVDDSKKSHTDEFDKSLRHNIFYSSCPGLLTSVDDFYTMSGRANLAVTETS